ATKNASVVVITDGALSRVDKHRLILYKIYRQLSIRRAHLFRGPVFRFRKVHESPLAVFRGGDPNVLDTLLRIAYRNLELSFCSYAIGIHCIIWLLPVTTLRSHYQSYFL